MTSQQQGRDAACYFATRVSRLGATQNTIPNMRVVRTILFHLLSTFRGWFLFVCRLLSGVSLLGLFLAPFVGIDSVWARVALLVSAVGFTALSWYYDVLMLKLKPDNVDLTLLQ